MSVRQARSNAFCRYRFKARALEWTALPLVILFACYHIFSFFSVSVSEFRLLSSLRRTKGDLQDSFRMEGPCEILQPENKGAERLFQQLF